MKVKDTFPYFSAKTPILVTEGVGKVLFDGDRNEMPENIKNRPATMAIFLFHERKFWVSVYELPEIKIDKERLQESAKWLVDFARRDRERRALIYARFIESLQKKEGGTE